MQPDGTQARAGEWVHLVGVHDTVANTLTLYVNGARAGSTQLAGAFYADQSMYIGAGSYSGRVDNHFPGTIDDVRLFDRPVSATEAQQLFKQRALVKGRWTFQQAAGSPLTTPDASASGNDMTLNGGAQIGAGWVDGGLFLDGVNDYATTSTVPVNTSASFTVTAWAQAAAVPKKTATDGHPFWVPELHAWINATDLRTGQWLRTSAGTHIQITAVKHWTQQATAHNLTITDLHTYYVLAGATPVLVHNCNRAGLDFTDAERQKVYDANAAKNGGEYKCDYCGQTVERRASRDASGNAIKGSPDDAQIDHVEPRASGGHGGDHNGAVACRRCNRDKSTKPLEDWGDELREFLDD